MSWPEERDKQLGAAIFDAVKDAWVGVTDKLFALGRRKADQGSCECEWCRDG